MAVPAQPTTHQSGLQLLPTSPRSASPNHLESTDKGPSEGQSESSSSRHASSAEPAKSPVKGRWPGRPQRLRNNARADIYSTALEVVLACVPVLFFVLAGLVVHIRGQEISEYGQGVVQATRLGPSIFPIVFATVVGGMMHNFALWRAQKRAPLGLIEQLNGSTSVAGTISTILTLRRAGIITVPILLIWALSPIGGQAALRMVLEEPSVFVNTSSIEYENMMGAIFFTGGPGFLFLPIPFLHTLPQDDSSQEDNPWIAVSNDANFSYSSLIGNILSKVPADRRAEFPLETSYFDARCHRLVANMPSNEAFHKLGGEHWLMHNASTLWNLSASSTGSLESNFFIDTSYNFSYPESPNSSVNLLYGSVDGVPTPGNNAAIFNCSISLVYTESWIDCTNATCAVTRMRRSEKNEPFLNPYHEMDYWKVRTLMSEFPHATGPIDSLTSSLTDGYIYGDPPHDYASGFREWEDINEADMSTRLTTALNTYWQATSNVPSIQSTRISGTKYLSSLNGTNATTFNDVQVYGVSSAWLTVFIISTVILQVSALASLLLKFITVAPNILGYVSSMTRENPYTRLPAGGSGLGGMERSNLLQDLHVQIAGVSEHGRGDGDLDATRVALVSRDSESKLQIQDLRQGQQYL